MDTTRTHRGQNLRHLKSSALDACPEASDVQGFVNPPRVRGKGQQGKGQGKDFMTLNKP